MQITDEMVDEACFVYQQQGSMRAALEAALGLREPNNSSDLLKHLRAMAELTAQGMKNSKPEDYLEGQAAACIEDLAGALKEVISVSDRATDIYNRARATLERWGLK